MKIENLLLDTNWFFVATGIVLLMGILVTFLMPDERLKWPVLTFFVMIALYGLIIGLFYEPEVARYLESLPKVVQRLIAVGTMWVFALISLGYTRFARALSEAGCTPSFVILAFYILAGGQAVVGLVFLIMTIVGLITGAF